MTSFFSSPGDDGSSGSSWFFWGAIIIGLAGLLVILFPMMRGFWMRFQMSRQRHRAIRKSRKDIYLRTRLAEVARGGREGEAAEPDVLRRRISELKQSQEIIRSGSAKNSNEIKMDRKMRQQIIRNCSVYGS